MKPSKIWENPPMPEDKPTKECEHLETDGGICRFCGRNVVEDYNGHKPTKESPRTVREGWDDVFLKGMNKPTKEETDCIGVSQWKYIGEKYGYWDYFRQQEREEYLKSEEGKVYQDYELMKIMAEKEVREELIKTVKYLLETYVWDRGLSDDETICILENRKILNNHILTHLKSL